MNLLLILTIVFLSGCVSQDAWNLDRQMQYEKMAIACQHNGGIVMSPVKNDNEERMSLRALRDSFCVLPR